MKGTQVLNKLEIETITVDRKKFVKILQSLKKVSPSRTKDVCLQRAHIFYEDGAIYVASSNTEQTVKRKLCDNTTCQLNGNFSLFTVLDFARKAKTDEIELSFNGNGSLLITSGATNFTDLAFSKDMWELNYRDPTKWVPDVVQSFSYPIGELRRVFDDVAYAMSYEESRYYLGGVFMHRNESNSLSFVATDGCRLSKRVLDKPDCEDDQTWRGVIIPKETVKFFLDFTKGLEGRVTVRLTDSRLSFEIGDVLLMTCLIDGNYPDYARVIPRDNHLCISVKRIELLENLDIFSIQKKSTTAIAFSFDANTDTLNIERSSKKEGRLSTSVRGSANAPEVAEAICFGLTPGCVIEMLNSVDCETLDICIGVSEKKDENGKPYNEFDGGPISFISTERSQLHDVDVLMPRRV